MQILFLSDGSFITDLSYQHRLLIQLISFIIMIERIPHRDTTVPRSNTLLSYYYILCSYYSGSLFILRTTNMIKSKISSIVVYELIAFIRNSWNILSRSSALLSPVRFWSRLNCIPPCSLRTAIEVLSIRDDGFLFPMVSGI